MLKCNVRGATVLGFVLALAAQGEADQSKKGARSKSTAVEKSDQRFLVEAAMDHLAEVKLGQLGLDKAQSQDVKGFAQRLIDDHSKSLDQIEALAAEQEIKMPDRVDEKHNPVFTRLSRVSGAEFDRTFMKEMIQDHEAEIREYEKEAASAAEPGIKAWARESLPVLRDHLQSARDIAKRLLETGEKPS